MQIRAKTAADVERALNTSRRTLADFMALISPAAEAYLPQMAAEAERLTRQRFGNTIGFYVPLYLSNLCANDCTYCGFSMSNRLKRKTLNSEEIERECLAIKARGFDSVLLVTGEHEHKVGLAYFRQVLPIIRRHFSTVGMEVQPLSGRIRRAENPRPRFGHGLSGDLPRPHLCPPPSAWQQAGHRMAPRHAGSARPCRYRQDRAGGADRSLLGLARRQLLCRRAPRLAGAPPLAEPLLALLPAPAPCTGGWSRRL